MRVLLYAIPTILVSGLLFLNSTYGQDKQELQLGELPNMLARLAWAEKHCNGSAPPATGQIRLVIRKLMPEIYAEAELTEENKIRTGQYGTFDNTTAESCRHINWEFGIDGRTLPGLWLTFSELELNMPRSPWVVKWNSNDRFMFGDLVGILQDIYFANQFCEGVPSLGGKALLDAFSQKYGRAIFLEQNPLVLGTLNSKEYWNTRCKSITGDYGPRGLVFPVLWRSTTRTGIDTEATTRSKSSLFAHGILRMRENRKAIAPFSIKTRSGSNYFFKMVDLTDQSEVMAGFIEGGKLLTAQMPLGSYELRYAVGKSWSDEADFFGPETVFSKADAALSFTIEGAHVSGVAVELILQEHGNLNTISIPREKF